ncbi:unnamed protein product [Diabrotica balteata]|uniref:Large ribosomal subunit protein bL9m n=1 Tax=Diabrotica balteata TaxID=107213 RepID=A0A9N9T7V0_DIABA|nr:unnamed protein product [Diabrotica balteata]
MWKAAISTVTSTLKTQSTLLTATDLVYQQARTTYVLKRKYPVLLNKKGHPKKPLRSKHYVYEVVRNTHHEPQSNIEVVLTSVVEGLGNVGDKVSLKVNKAYNNLLLTGLAVYPTPENEAKYKSAGQSKDLLKYSSPSAANTVQSLSRMMLSVVMNKETPWTIKPWHIKASFRKCGYFVPEEAITIPGTPISGPNMDLEGKEFAVTVTINKQEKVNVRCRLHHWSTEVASRLPYVPEFWKIPTESILPEQASLLETMPKKKTMIKKQ